MLVRYLPRVVFPVAAIALAAGVVAASSVQADSAMVPGLPQAADLIVLPPLGPSAPLPTSAGLAAVLAGPMANAAMGPGVLAAVYDAQTGASLFEQGGSTPAMPASTNKLLTSAAVLTAYGADQAITTRVVKGAGASELVLVGAGDPLLKIAKPKSGEEPVASLTELATQTAAAIKLPGNAVTQPVSIRFDDSLFSGPTTAPSWPASYGMPPITALMVDGGYRASGQSDPSTSAAMAFAKLLGTHGIKVAGAITRQVAGADAGPVAAAKSQPISALVQHTLELSDNTAAEVLAHLAGAKTGNGGSFDGGVAASLGLLGSLSIPTAGVTLVDGSGLSRSDQIPPVVLTRLLASIAMGANPQLWAVAAGNPIAGFTGTLADHFLTPTSQPGAGVVRAKTGTLTGVSALAGLVTTSDGALLAFAFVAPNAVSLPGAEAQWDTAAAGLATCGCRP